MVVRSYHAGFTALPVLVLIAVVAFAFLAVSEVAFERIGFTPFDYMLILFATLVGSVVNLPLWSSTKLVAVPTVREVEAFWVTYRIPVYEEREVSTVVAINIGGPLNKHLEDRYKSEASRWRNFEWLSNETEAYIKRQGIAI